MSPPEGGRHNTEKEDCENHQNMHSPPPVSAAVTSNTQSNFHYSQSKWRNMTVPLVVGLLALDKNEPFAWKTYMGIGDKLHILNFIKWCTLLSFLCKFWLSLHVQYSLINIYLLVTVTGRDECYPQKNAFKFIYFIWDPYLQSLLTKVYYLREIIPTIEQNKDLVGHISM